MESLIAATVRPGGASPSRRPLSRFLAIAPVALLLSGLLTVVGGGPVALAASGDWTQFHNDATHSGYNSTESIISASNASSLGVAWAGATPDVIYYSSPAVANGVVYVASQGGYFSAYAVGCGSDGGYCSPLWTADIGSDAYSSPAVANGVVYVGSFIENGTESGMLYAFDAAGVTNCTVSGGTKTCTPLWTAATDGGIYESSPTVANGKVYVGDTDSLLYAFDAAGVDGCSGTPKTCSPLWTGNTYAGGIMSSPAVANGVVYVGTENGYLWAFDADGGAAHCSSGTKACTPLWISPVAAGPFFTSPTVANGTVYIGSGDRGDSTGTLYAYDAAGGTSCPVDSSNYKECPPLWTATVPGAIRSSPAVANGVVWVGSDDKKLYAFAQNAVLLNCNMSSTPHTCSPIWTSAATGGAIGSSPAVANGVVYVASEDQKLYAYQAACATNHILTCKSLLGSYSTGASPYPSDCSPAVSNGVVYVGLVRTLYAFRVMGAQTLKVTVATNPTVAGVAHSVTVKAVDAYGNVATGYTGTIHFTSTDTKAVLPADYTFTAADKGVHKFTNGLTLKTAGTEYVTATDMASSSIHGTKSDVVTPGAAKTLGVAVAANPYAAGSTHSVTVKALDSYGNVVTGYAGKVHFTSTDSAAILPADYTFTAANSGSHKFTNGVTLKTAGARSVTVTDKSSSSIKGSQTVTVTPGVAKTLTVSIAASPYPVGTAHSVTVTAVDAYGNTATGYVGTIHFTSSDSAAILPGNYTFTGADKGSHKFTNGLTLKTKGSRWVRATDTVTSSITGSATVTVQ